MTQPKIKIMNTQPPITDEEIRSHMDFDRLLVAQEAAMANKKARIKTVRIVAIIVGILAISFVAYFTLQQKETPIATNPEIAASQVIEKKKAVEKTQPSDVKQQSAPQNKKKEVIKKPVLPTNTPSTKTQATTQPSDASYIEAEPVDGFPALYDYFNRELKYPEAAVKDSLQGVVTVSFLLTKEGKPIQIKTINSMGHAFDQEALRLIEKMPPWKPARMNGNPVASKISLPLTFHLKTVKPQ